MFEPVLQSLPAFASFFLTAIALLTAFLALYIRVTPYNELALIRDGNTAAAISLGGAALGFALPLAVSVAVSHNLPAMLGWGGVAGVVQLATYLAVRLALPGINQAIPQGQVASGIVLAAFSLGVGVLNAGCIA